MEIFQETPTDEFLKPGPGVRMTLRGWRDNTRLVPQHYSGPGCRPPRKGPGQPRSHSVRWITSGFAGAWMSTGRKTKVRRAEVNRYDDEDSYA